VPEDGNQTQDVFLYDRQIGVTKLVSRAMNGSTGNGLSGQGKVNPDGTFIVFTSAAANLVPGDTNGFEDIFLYEIATGAIRRVSLAEDGSQGNGLSQEGSICEGGRFVSWTSDADNLVAGDTNNERDNFFYDVVQDKIRIISVTQNGLPANMKSHRSHLTPDCRLIAYASAATNLVPGDTNDTRDLFMGTMVWPFNLSTSSQHAPAFANPGDMFTYVVKVRNSGVESGAASFIAPVPEHTSFVSGSGTNGVVYNSTLNRVEWNGTVQGETEVNAEFSVIVSPALTETVFLRLETVLTGDNIGYTFENLTIVNGYYFLLPAVYRP
jgi:uncharacterized repeat protein (TIGR01451 family)